MKTNMDRFSLSVAALVALMTSSACCAELDYFLSPPGSVWARVLFTNFASSRAMALERCQEGFVVGGEVRLSGDSLYDSAALAVVAEDGAILRTNVFLGLEYPVWGRLGCGVSAVTAATNSMGQPDGYVITGYKCQYFLGLPSDPRPEWINPTLWVMKTDLLLQPVWETNVARGMFEYGPGLARWGTAVVQTPDGFVVTGQAYADYLINPLDTDSGSMGLGCLLRLDHEGRVVELREAQQLGNEWLASGPKSIERTSDGGYLLVIHESTVKLNTSLMPVRTNTQAVWCYDVKTGTDGGWTTVGRQRGTESPIPVYRNVVLSSYAPTGVLQWSSTFGHNSTNDFGRSLVDASGSFAVAGQTDSMGAGGKDVWVIKTDSAGTQIWDIALGGQGLDAAYGAALGVDGRYVLGGEAQVGTNHWMWVVKVRTDLHVPVAAFSYQPVSPVFRDQVITFDASASSNPGGEILSYRWNFGDGTTGSGITAQHSYSVLGIYDVTLEVMSADGPRSWATQSVELAGLVMQWQRFYGATDTYAVSGLLPTPDGGFVVAGGTGGSSLVNNHLWAFKVDRRGLPVWERLYDGPGSEAEYAQGLVHGTDGGYVMAGHYGRSANHDAFLLKVGDDGEPAWPMKLFGVAGQDQQALCLVQTIDGGYLMGGVNSSLRPMLIKTDAAGNEVWTRNYDMDAGRIANRILATPDGGALFYADANGSANWFIRVDASGLPIWTNVLGYRENCYWVGHQHVPEQGFAVVGAYYKDIWLSFLSPDGVPSGSRSWSGPAVFDQNDIAYGAALSPDGGYILTGVMRFRETPYGHLDTEVVLLKTDSNGALKWIETFPGTANCNETGDAILALTDGSYIVVGDDGNSSTPPVWMFKVAPNSAPTAIMELSTNVIAIAEPLFGDALDSTDRDGTVVGWEWDFGDHQTGTGVSVNHIYTNSGAYEVHFTAVDNKDAERSVTNTVSIYGVRTGAGFTISDTSITNCPGCDSTTYPREGVPLMIDWDNSLGFVISGTATSGSTKTFRITFPYPVPEGLSLYRLPPWTKLSCTVVDKHTIEVKLWLNAGNYVLPFVLAKAAPLPTISAFQWVASQVSLSFVTTPGYRYTVQKTDALALPAWTEVKHARNPGDPATDDLLDGSGLIETVYVDPPASGLGFFRIRMQSP